MSGRAESFANILAQEEVLDHAKHPRNLGELPGAAIRYHDENPLCGDAVTVFADVLEATGEQPSVGRMTFTGHGCVISQAAASLLSEHVVGKPFGEIERLERAQIEQLLGSSVSVSRVKCAMLSLVALKRGIAQYRRPSDVP
jgi:nitrogen fixation NifU-like protein